MKMVAEKWLNIFGYEGYYQVSNLGKVKSVDRMIYKPSARMGFPRLQRGKLHKPGYVGRGYLAVSLSKNGKIGRFYVHRLVATTFIKNPKNKPEVNHKD